MKKIFTLFFSSLLSLSLLAYDGSRLSISSVTNGNDLRIEIDGRKVNMRDNSITLNNIGEGSHSIRIFKERKNAYGFTKKQAPLYTGNVFIRRGFHTDILINRFGKVFVDEQRIDRNDDWYSEEDYEEGNEGWDPEYSHADVMSTREFDLLKEQLRKEWFENNRLTSAKVIIDKTNFTSVQVKELMLMFSFENNRLDIAKSAYRKTIDKQSYFQVNEALNFNSSRDELARFIRESR